MPLPMRFSLQSCLCATFIAAAFHQPASAQEKAAPPVIECRWAADPITVDGKADDPDWKVAQPIEPFGQPWLGKDAKPTKTATKAKLLWDKDYLYFFGELEDHDLFADIALHDGRTWYNDV